MDEDSQSDLPDWGDPAPYLLADDGTYTSRTIGMEGWDYYYRSRVYRQRQRYDLAIADLDEAIRLDERDPEVYFRQRADYYAKLGDYEFAIFSLGEGIDRTGDLSLHIQRACYAYMTGNVDFALADLNRAALSKPFIALAFLVRGMVHQDIRHDYKSALLDYSFAMSIAGSRLHRQTKTRYRQVLDLLKASSSE